MHKLIRLRLLLRGEAGEFIEGLDWESSDYFSAWKILEDEYGGHERFINHQMDIILYLMDIKQVKTVEDIQQFS